MRSPWPVKPDWSLLFSGHFIATELVRVVGRVPVEAEGGDLLVRFWVARADYPILRLRGCVSYNLRVIITCGDNRATQNITLMIDLSFTYVQFASLAPSSRGDASWGSDLELYLLPPNFPLAKAHNVVALCNTVDSSLSVGGVLVKMSWAGPLGHLSWADPAPPSGIFILLMLTGTERCAKWANRETYKAWIRAQAPERD